MPINTNPTGLFPIAQLGDDTPYTYVANGETVTSTGGGIYIPLTDLEDYIPSANVLNEAHSDADYRYLVLALSEVTATHFGGLSQSDKPKNVNLTKGQVTSTSTGKLHKSFTNKFWYNPDSLRLDVAEDSE